MTSTPPTDRVHVDASGLTLTDSDLAMLSRALGRVLTWPPLRGEPPAQAWHLATIRTVTFGGRPGGDIVAAMWRYDDRRRAAAKPPAFGPEFIASCSGSRTVAARRERPATRSPELGVDVLRMWLGN